nr:hypothetical protein [Providencia rettgeri]
MLKWCISQALSTDSAFIFCFPGKHLNSYFTASPFFVTSLNNYYNLLDNNNKRFNHKNDLSLPWATANARVICDERLRVITSAIPETADGKRKNAGELRLSLQVTEDDNETPLSSGLS